MKKTVARYDCTMPALYIICRLGWQLCRNNLADFAGFSAIYTGAYVDAQLQAVKDAEKIENEQRRNAVASDLRLDAEASALQVCSNWQSLKYYIGQAFAGPKLENALQSAGASAFAKAYNCNWAELQVLMNAGKNFITDNQAALTAKGNMPADLPAVFAANAGECLEKWLRYAANKSNKSDVALNKIVANNALYTSLQSMCATAGQLYKHNPLKQLFTFASFKTLAQGNGTGSVHGKVTDALTGRPVGDVSIAVPNSNLKASTNKRGFYKGFTSSTSLQVHEFTGLQVYKFTSS